MAIRQGITNNVIRQLKDYYTIDESQQKKELIEKQRPESRHACRHHPRHRSFIQLAHAQSDRETQKHTCGVKVLDGSDNTHAHGLLAQVPFMETRIPFGMNRLGIST
jgi:hypothetical protein